MQTQNPFEAIDKRLSSIENLLFDLTQNKKPVISLPEISDLLTIKEAADFLHLTVATCYTKVSRRELPVMKKTRRLYFSKADLIKWLQQGRRKTNEEIEQQATDYLTSKKSKKCQ